MGGEDVADEARHHLLKLFFRIGVRMDERDGGMRDDPFFPSLAYDHRTDDLGVESHGFALPFPGKPKLQPGHSATAVLDESAADSDVQDECAVPIECRQNGFRQFQPLELSTFL